MDISRSINKLKTRYKDIEKYAEIMTKIRATDISKDEDLQRMFNAFCRVRRNAAWRKEFYDLFEACKTKKDLTFEIILREMFKRTGRIEASFSSKMLATLNPQMPIWDSIVISKLGYKPKMEGDKEKRIVEAVQIYDEMVDRYNAFLEKDISKEFLTAFDKAFPEFREMSDVKKIDFILWGGGEDNPLLQLRKNP